VPARLFHVGLTVSDLDRSLGFYQGVAGLEVQSVVDVDSEGFGRLTSNPGARLRTALLSDGQFTLQLVNYLEGGGKPIRIDHRDPGAPHLSFWVEDVDSLYGNLRETHVVVTSEIVEVIAGVRSFYVADPDGVPVEFIQNREADSGD
jgi:catechol 2,3-dioxygenase-like lactoylglutathione lyase family enzyme